MPIFGSKNETSVSVKVTQLTLATPFGDPNPLLLQNVPSLIDLIQVQPNSGASEAARAIRKRIKYAPEQVQILALALLEILLLNAGPRIGPVIARDEKLLDLLKGIITGLGRTASGAPFSALVRESTIDYARGWKHELGDLPDYKYFATLHKYILGSRRDRDAETAKPRLPPRANRSQKLPSKPSLSEKLRTKKKAHAKRKERRINYTVEAPKMRALIARSLTASTGLTNLLAALPSLESPLDDDKTHGFFLECKRCRSKVLAYLQHVGTGDESSKTLAVREMDAEFLGSLISANEQLLAAFTKFDAKCGIGGSDPTYGENLDSGESYYTSEDEEEAEIDMAKLLVGKRAPPPPPTLSSSQASRNVSRAKESDAADPFADDQGM